MPQLRSRLSRPGRTLSLLPFQSLLSARMRAGRVGPTSFDAGEQTPRSTVRRKARQTPVPTMADQRVQVGFAAKASVQTGGDDAVLVDAETQTDVCTSTSASRLSTLPWHGPPHLRLQLQQHRARTTNSYESMITASTTGLGQA